MLTRRLPNIIMAAGALFFGWLTYDFNVNGDGGADGLGMYFFIVFAAGACLLFLIGFLCTLFLTNKGDTIFKGILLALVLLCIGYVVSVVFNPSIDEFEIETTSVID